MRKTKYSVEKLPGHLHQNNTIEIEINENFKSSSNNTSFGQVLKGKIGVSDNSLINNYRIVV